VLPAPEDLPFPHVSQVMLIERYVSDLAGNLVSAAAAFGVASPAADRASAAGLARHVREQWSIESLHWLRDTLYQEDKSQVRTRSGPRVMTALLGYLCPAPVRTHRCHRSHPMGRAVHEPALRYPRPHIMILKRPWVVRGHEHLDDRQHRLGLRLIALKRGHHQREPRGVSETVLPRLAVWTVRSFKAMFRPRLTSQPEALAHPDCVLTAA